MPLPRTEPPAAEAVPERGPLAVLEAMSPFAACLMPLLGALGWRGKPRDVAEVLPHFAETIDLVDLRNALAGLGFESQPARTRLKRIDPRLLPCLFVPDRGGCVVLLRREGRDITLFDGASGETRQVRAKRLGGTAFYFTDTNAARAPKAPPADRWFVPILRRFRGAAGRLLGITLALNLLALAVPLFTMVVYDKVIGSRSLPTLYALVAGIAVVLVADLLLRALRARVIGAVAGRLDYILGVEAFRQILALAPEFTERASVGAQIARLKQFEAVREFFTGPLISLVLELPFILLFVGVIAWLAGPLALVPLVMIAAFAAFGWVYLPLLRDAVMAASRSRAGRQGFLVEALGRMRAIKSAAADEIWRDRFRVLSAEAATTGYLTARRSAVLHAATSLLMTLAGIAVLGFGALRVLDGAMSVGALIATMTLVWRVLSPLQAGLLAFTRLEQVRLSIRQMEQLMRLPTERQPGKSPLLERRLKGAVRFERVSFRYSNDTDPVLLGASFEVAPGEMVAVVGANGSGKSTVLKLFAAMYQPQAGAVLVDGLDIRQIDPVELRRIVAYVPQTPHLFHGSIAQNLRLADPTATDEALARAAAEAGVLQTVLDLPEGFETRIGDTATGQLPQGFAQRLAIARALVRNSPILLLDEPATSLDRAGDEVLMDLLKRLRGRATVLMTSHRPSHIRLTDRVIVLDRGMVLFEGPPANALPFLQGRPAA